jgi:S1-C subfamily serine protease
VKLFTLFAIVVFSIFANYKGYSEPVYSIPVIPYIQSISVLIKCGSSEGSGVIITRKDTNSELNHFVLTCAHVMSDYKIVKTHTNTVTKEIYTVVDQRPIEVIKRMVENGDTVGKIVLYADLIKYSDRYLSDDLALLRIRKKNYFDFGVQFYSDSKIPEIGSELYHMGSFFGEQGAESLSTGIYSQVGRSINGIVFDQVSTPLHVGSSGGGVYFKDGLLVGISARKVSDGYGLIIPTRRIFEWAKRNKIEWILDSKSMVPLADSDYFKQLEIDDESLK